MSLSIDRKPAKTSWARGEVQVIGRGPGLRAGTASPTVPEDVGQVQQPAWQEIGKRELVGLSER